MHTAFDTLVVWCTALEAKINIVVRVNGVTALDIEKLDIYIIKPTFSEAVDDALEILIERSMKEC